MPAERLSAQDATLWCAQDPRAPLLIGAVCIYERGPLAGPDGSLRIDDLRRHLESRLHRVPRFRQRLAEVPGGQGRPLWVDDTDFDIEAHAHAAALPTPGGQAELDDFVAQLLATPLDPRRPLWEMWIVDGLEGDRVAVIPKVSHVMADGLALLGFALAILDFEPDAPPVEAPPWHPEPAPSGTRMITDAVADQARTLVDGAFGIARAVARPRELASQLAALGDAALGTAAPAPRLAVNGPVGARRGFLQLQLPLEEVLAVKRDTGVTFNDVGLALATLALHRYLADKGDHPPGTRPRVLVPVSTHGTQPGGEIENRFAQMVADLPGPEVPPAECLAEIHEEMVRRKASSQTEIAPVLYSLAVFTPGWLLGRLAPVLLRNQPFINLAVSDLPGSRDPLYLLGSRMLELVPFITCTGNMALMIGVLSYVDTLGVGITVDPDVVPDVEALGEALRWAVGELARDVLGDRATAAG
ncbi:MAG: wax ester/triacylglycerol synthase family O-acyltransferase [Acidimicrobiales bacterium]|jgi:WS/DGAT/MGAT family acyltransferase|nr:wax ester/triacylglycerol synthase family O-acyltransferase [Acidimicrobiales bacterium]